MCGPILVVDDSADTRAQLSQALCGAGYTVVDAADGPAGLAQLTAHDDVALVLCDIDLPRMGGLELLTQVHQTQATLPVVMLTRGRDPTKVRHARDAGARGWFVKPFNPALLVLAVQRLVA